ncbi:hypothetical protein OROGR_033182 [Orobanche gracilis]
MSSVKDLLGRLRGKKKKNEPISTNEVENVMVATLTEVIGGTKLSPYNEDDEIPSPTQEQGYNELCNVLPNFDQLNNSWIVEGSSSLNPHATKEQDFHQGYPQDYNPAWADADIPWDYVTNDTDSGPSHAGPTEEQGIN